MLRFYNHLAGYLHRYRRLLWLLLTAALASFCGLMITADPRLDGYAVLAVVVFLWSLCLLMVTAFFPTELPAVRAGDSLLVRWRRRLGHAAIWGIVVLASIIGGTTALVSLRLFVLAMPTG